MAGELLFFSADDVRAVLIYDDLIPAMETALARFSDREKGGVVQPVRSTTRVNKYNGVFLVMPAYSEKDNALATKVVSFYPENKAVPTHHALIVLLEPTTGVPKAVMDGEIITAMRTAAASAAVTKGDVSCLQHWSLSFQPRSLKKLSNPYLAPPYPDPSYIGNWCSGPLLTTIGLGVQGCSLILTTAGMAVQRLPFYPATAKLGVQGNCLILTTGWVFGAPSQILTAVGLGVQGFIQILIAMGLGVQDLLSTVGALCKPSPHILAIVGAGVQGHSHYHSLSSIYNFTEVRIASRTLESAEKLVTQVPNGRVCDSVEEAVKGADIIVMATSAMKPLLKADWVKAGTHINAVGACKADWQELDPDLVRSSVLVVDSREAAMVESGDVILSKAEIFAEAGELFQGWKKPQTDQTTIFKSLGIGVEDTVAAKLVYDKILQQRPK
ncbi:ketimine reductase mu-crystallin-like [Liolophura sinensis]|uniref:ketimine reductase mu-crystallin-like n=1 Tax=Liolophura sinensis TaxID=3198878 RepID=UPI00315928D4